MFERVFDRLKPAIFKYKKDMVDGLQTEKQVFGIMAQDIRDGLKDEGFSPDDFSIVEMQDTGYYSVDYIQLIPLLVSKIKQLELDIRRLEEK